MSRLKVYDLATGTWKYGGGVDPTALAADIAFTSKYAPLAKNGAAARRLANQSIPNNSVTLMSFDNESYDTNSLFSPPSTNITIQSDGVYACTFQAVFSASPGTSAWVSVGINGGRQGATACQGDVISAASFICPLSAGMTISGVIYQISGAAINATGALFVTRIAV